MRHFPPAVLLAVLLLLPSCVDPAPLPGAGGVRAPQLESGALAVAERQAAEVGAVILRSGGNAVDAAVAVQFALAVTFPVAGNIGGGGFMVLHVPGEGDIALDYRETAPGAAHPSLFQDENGDVVDQLSLRSHLGVGVPGTVRGMWELHARFGSLPWESLLAPAISLAEDGYVLDEWTAGSFERARAKFAALPERFGRVNNFARYFNGAPGETFLQGELASTLRRIAETGADGFYQGETARLIVEEMARGEGIITLEDLASYQARWREPVVADYHGYRVVSMSPPSSGGIALIQMLNLFERFELPTWHSREHLHLVAEIEKRVFADRAAHLGDADFYPVAVDELISEEYAAKRAQGIHLDARTSPEDIHAGAVGHESFETTHFSIVDASGMAVSNTTTLNAAYGTGIVVKGAGFLLNNQMDDFSAKPGVPNLFGVTGGEANKVEAGKRMLSSMTPTLVFDEAGALRLVLGSPGGPTIITSVFQVISNILDYDMSLDEAVRAPRFHHQWPPRKEGVDPILVEKRPEFAMPPARLAELETMGYTIETLPRLGDVQAVEVLNGKAHGMADPRLVGASVSIEHQP